MYTPQVADATAAHAGADTIDVLLLKKSKELWNHSQHFQLKIFNEQRLITNLHKHPVTTPHQYTIRDQHIQAASTHLPQDEDDGGGEVGICTKSYYGVYHSMM